LSSANNYLKNILIPFSSSSCAISAAATAAVASFGKNYSAILVL